ncbi:hypothetical protein [Micromonospora sp. NPDC005652]|uniref:hypothetical protein n=1 Tax=Micromonospora sp. NPDC005652 TaxID=3157046 RepID=UPI0033D1DB27
MAYDVGTAVLHVVPSFKNIEGELKKFADNLGKQLSKNASAGLTSGLREANDQVEKQARETGDKVGKQVADGVSKGLKQAADAAGKHTDKIAKDVSGAYERGIRNGAERALSRLAIPDAKVKLSADAGDLNALRELLKGVLDDEDVLGTAESLENLRALRDEFNRLARDSAEQEVRFNADAAMRDLDQIFDALPTTAERAAQRAAEAQEREFRRMSQRAAQEQIRAAEAVAKEQERIAEQAARESEALAQQRGRALASLVAGRAKAAREAASAELTEVDRLAREAARLAERTAQESARRAEDAFNATWAGRIRRNLINAYRNIPDLRIDVDSSEAEQRVAALRNRLVHLSDLRVGVDVDTATAQQHIVRLRYELDQVAQDRSLDLSVRVASAEAAAELAMLVQLIERLDGRRINLNVNANTTGARAQMAALSQSLEVNIGRLGALIVTISSLGPAVVPVAAAATATIGFLGTAAASAAAGVGVLILAFAGVGEAVKALNDYQENAAKSAVAISAAQARVASATDSVTSATRSLANTRANAVSAARRSAEAIADAERAVGDARRAAAEAVSSANRRVADTQRGLTRAELDARDAREALTEAYQDALDAYADLDSAVQRNALDQREANLDIKKAKADLDRVLANPRATEEQREQAKITYERQVLQISDLQRRGKELAREQAEANRKGIEGSDQVASARRRLAEADQRVADSQRDLADARAAVVRAHLDGARRVADAEARVAEAQRAAADQQRQSAFSIAQAQQSVVAAQRQLQESYKALSVAGGESLDNLRKKMEELSPAGRRFAQFIYGLKPKLDELRATAQENLLPGVQASLENIMPFLPGFTDYVGRVSKSLGGLFEKTSDLLTNDPTWRRFFGYIDENTVPTLDRLWSIGEKVSTGLVGLFNAFTPFDEPVGQGLEDLAAKFERWATTLDQNKGFQSFLAYVREEGPRVAELLKQFGIFTLRFLEAAAPIGEVVVEVFIQLFEWLNMIPTDVLTVLIGAIVGVAAAIGVLGAITSLFAMGTAALVVVAIGALAAAFGVLVTQVDWLRDAWLLMTRLTTDAVIWLYEHSVKPTFAAIGWLIENVVGPAFSWLYSHVIKPVWQLIQVAFNTGVAVAKVAFGVFQIAVKLAGVAFRTLYDLFVKPTWDKIKPIFTWLGNLIDDEVKPKWDIGVKALGKIWDWLVDVTKAPIRFVVNTVLNDGLLKAYNFIAKKFKVKPDDVKIDLPPGFASGGAVIGPGTGVSDSVLARLSNGEHVWTAAEVAAAGGHQAVAAMRRAVLGQTAAFRDGGPVGDGIGDLFRKARKKATDVYEGFTDFLSDPGGTLRKLAGKLLDAVPGQGSMPVTMLRGVVDSIAGNLIDRVKASFGVGDQEAGVPRGLGNSLGGSAGMMRVLRAEFPGLPLISGYRAGATTLSGNRSYHASDRAVDVGPFAAVAKWIHDTWGRLTKELITPYQQYNLLNGRPHRYTGAVWNQHNFSGGNAHVHWAYDSGGMLPPGVSSVVNATGKPEPVLTNDQWQQIYTIARNSHGEQRAVQNHYHFREAALDIGRLQALQARQDALARAGRAR